MKIDEIHPSYRRAVRMLPGLPYSRPAWQPFVQWLYRRFFVTPVVDGVTTHDVQFGPVRLRVYVPDQGQTGAGMMWIHGGGMIVGTEVQDNTLCSTYARDLGLVVVSVGYRLAPQHPFPAASDDCFAAWQWFLEHAADYGVARERIVIASESGGGSHGASLAHRIHDHGGVQPAGQMLFEPMLDDRTAADPSLAKGYFVWRWKDNYGGWRAYLGHEPGQPSEPPYAVPARREDLSGLPPTWFGIGTKDLFYAEGMRYVDGLRRAGVEVELVTIEGAPHGFHLLAPDAPGSREFGDRSYRWLRATLALDGATPSVARAS